MSAPKGNKFWKMADPSKIGRPLIFKTPSELWDKCCEYFEWSDNNPLLEERLFHYQGSVTREKIAKLRAYTLKELCIYLGVNNDYFNQFNDESNKEFSSVITRVYDVIYTQKFTGAAADLLNPNIIARDLGLAEKTDNRNTTTEFYIGGDNE